MAVDDRDPTVEPIRPVHDGRAVRAAVSLVAVGAVVLIGFGLLTGSALLGSAGDGGHDGAAPGALAQVTPPETTPSPTKASASAAATPSITPYLVWPTPTSTPERTPPPDVAVVDHGAAPLQPSGVVVLGAASAATEWPALVSDAHGVVWAIGSGGLLRYDPVTRGRTVWTVADDLAFGKANTMVLVPARDVGVWIADQVTSTVRHFDGHRFLDILDAPGQVTALAEAPDGTLWVGTSTGLYRRDGASWTGMAFASEQVTVASLLADSRGRLWAGWLEYPTPPGRGWVTRWDGTSWGRFDERDALALGSPVQAIREAPDRTIWVGTSDGLARYDGADWSAVDEPLRGVSTIGWGPDGLPWIGSGGNGARVAHRTDGGWTLFGQKDGLPGPDESRWLVASVAPTAHGVFVGTGAGILRLAGGRWSAITPVRAGTPETPGWIRALHPVSRDEAWAADDRAIWHAVNGSWRMIPFPDAVAPDTFYIGDLLLDRQRRLWVASVEGVRVREDGDWTKVDALPATELALGPDGRVWAIGDGEAPGGLHARAFTRRGEAWTASALPVTSLISWVKGLAVDRDGVVWAGSPGNWGIKPGLIRYTDDGGWEKVAARGVTPDEAIWDIADSPDGVAWAVGSDVVPVGTATSDVPTTPPPWWIARLTPAGAAVAGEDPGWPSGSLAVLRDGTPIVTAAARGLGTWDGRAWTYRLDGQWLDRVSVAPDGAIWVVASGGVWVLP